ncbi:serine/threonine-protein kinase Nek6-like [Dreissena polymorpha]|uniref:serine/threonine-protein kinase Nek6-like n=1 Tax=Dreissena polymorpha TaxID=45954 RepID=UPI0022651DBB|nr:serine/threonine-protein kinase Nek6-like [Dreissena polymorpha]XP_052229258.1 serine/threonine-protein kinase Nek6-like [Dreissena polymorpha]
MVLRFNPLDGTAHQETTPHTAPALKYLCRQAIVSRIGMQNLEKVNTLPLPQRLNAEIATITLNDFLIEGDNLPPRSHRTKLYPATCLLTGEMVNIRIAQSAPERQDDNIVTSFQEGNKWVIVETQIKSLADLISECRSKGTKIDVIIIWRAIAKLISHLKDNNTAPTAHLSTDSIKFTKGTQKIHICLDSVNEMLVDPISNATYEAPEVFSSPNPDARAFVWSIGCIVYEALALAPAYYDPTGRNPFSVFQNILNGVFVAPMPASADKELRNLVSKCLVFGRHDRMTFEALEILVNAHSVV